MRLLALAAVTSLVCGAAAAQPAAPTLPRAFADYGQPDITPGLCKNISPTQSQCVIPAMTAGLYEITATGTSTATAAEAVQKLTIVVGQGACPPRQTNPKTAWPVSKPKTLKYSCVVNVLTDKPMIVTAYYADAKATKDPKGPTLVVKRLPWSGLLLVQPGPASQQ
jgi:hypothetical protein